MSCIVNKHDMRGFQLPRRKIRLFDDDNVAILKRLPAASPETEIIHANIIQASTQ